MIQDIAELAYWFGQRPVKRIVRHGRIVTETRA